MVWSAAGLYFTDHVVGVKDGEVLFILRHSYLGMDKRQYKQYECKFL